MVAAEEREKVAVLVRRPEAAQEEAPGPEPAVAEEEAAAMVWRIPRRWRVY